jgi:hypothetical protein
MARAEVTTVAQAVALIEAATGPEDLFGGGGDADRHYRRLARLTHPDACPGDIRAAAAFAKLAKLWQRRQDGRGPLAARCVTELAGARMPGRLARFAAGCMPANPRRRPRDAWQLLAELDELLDRMYGPRAFRPFAMPA